MRFTRKMGAIFTAGLLLGVILGLMIGCGGGGSDRPAPTITDFSASAATINWGEVASLSAAFDSGTGIITPGGIAIASGSSVSITPTTTTTYTLTVSDSAGTTATKTTTVNVNAATERRYLITDLGSLGGASIVPASVNSVGQVTGTAKLSDGSDRAFFWDKGTLVNLGTFPGYPSSEAFSINNSGQVVGTCPTGTIYPPPGPGPAGGKYPTAHAFIWKDGVMEHLGTANVSDGHTPYCINDGGVVVGESQTIGHPGEIFYSAVKWENANFFFLPGGGGRGTRALAVNSAGIAVGTGRNSDLSLHALLWEGQSGKDLNTFVPAGSPWTLQEAVGVNANGQVVGNGIATGLSGAFILENDTITDLGFLYPGGRSEAKAINASGWVVGRTIEVNDWRAFVWRRGWMADLNQLIPPGSGWAIEVALSISDTGFIVGTGKHDGLDRAFILTPP